MAALPAFGHLDRRIRKSHTNCFIYPFLNEIGVLNTKVLNAIQRNYNTVVDM